MTTCQQLLKNCTNWINGGKKKQNLIRLKCENCRWKTTMTPRSAFYTLATLMSMTSVRGTRGVSSEPFRSSRKVARTRKKFNSIENRTCFCVDCWLLTLEWWSNGAKEFIIMAIIFIHSSSPRQLHSATHYNILHSMRRSLNAFQCIESIVSHTILRDDFVCATIIESGNVCGCRGKKKTRNFFFISTAAEVQFGILRIAAPKCIFTSELCTNKNENEMKQKKRRRAKRWRRFRWR